MKRLLICLLLILILSGCSSTNYQSVDGIIVDTTMKTIVVRVDDTLYEFNHTKAHKEYEGKPSLMSGKAITVYYLGELDSNELLQNCKVEKISVYNSN